MPNVAYMLHAFLSDLWPQNNLMIVFIIWPPNACKCMKHECFLIMLLCLGARGLKFLKHLHDLSKLITQKKIEQYWPVLSTWEVLI